MNPRNRRPSLQGGKTGIIWRIVKKHALRCLEMLAFGTKLAILIIDSIVMFGNTAQQCR